MKFGSLFSGIGGMDLGLEWAGMECIWQVETDNYCNRVLAKHWPAVPRYGDIKNVGRHNLETPDLICGGFPCQPVSLAGKREAQADARWLWPEFARVVDELRPQYVFVENVPGLYTAGGSEVLADLATLRYDAEWHSIPAAAFGAPHKRERFILVANTQSREDNQREPGNLAEETEGREGVDTPVGDDSEDVADTRCGISNTSRDDKDIWRARTSPTSSKPNRENYWTIEPNVGRVAHGVPSRVDRLRGLGNAVVPQLAEWVGRNIMAREENNESERL